MEENHFGVRKRLLEYDDVMNAQREVIYKKRRETLMGERMGVNIMNMMYDSIVSIVDTAKNETGYASFEEELMRVASIDSPVSEAEFASMKEDAIVDKVFDAAMLAFKRKTETMTTTAMPVISEVFDKYKDMYENIIIPITDGKMAYRMPVNLKEAHDTNCKSIVKVFEKAILLRVASTKTGKSIFVRWMICEIRCRMRRTNRRILCLSINWSRITSSRRW